ncbi:acyl carrier protein [Pseudenhygromyxa sp. WMMC2535]|uniref:acyl carrier protein n=1 Tax=Pseudenhygromyxa sp. WMMC2535 TaxID=2712867 RepID=UPI0015534969|nr:acyl carrier protein [Pseudenhygromyxa sp. WMMC2535]NVB37535.1 acyl carrier protein [Pseudenhygromyxa sp. WMMC2535]
MQASEVNLELKRFITEQFLDGDGSDLEDATPLLEWGVIDSIGMFALLRFIQDEFAVQVPDAEVSPRNFHSVAVMQALVLRLWDEQEKSKDA